MFLFSPRLSEEELRIAVLARTQDAQTISAQDAQRVEDESPAIPAPSMRYYDGESRSTCTCRRVKDYLVGIGVRVQTIVKSILPLRSG
ncbi:MAG: hypothetical protein JNM79_24915 [Burkholderiales bacterium]|nr:hypothetical protein [Burkholderiales bacterium]